MKLSMHIFFDFLQSYHPVANIKSNEFDIEAVRLFSSDVTLEENTLYVGHYQDLFVGGDKRIICAHNNDLLLLDTTDLESVLNDVLNAISCFNKWDSLMLTLLTSGGMLQDLFDASENLLDKPAFLLDSAQRHLAHTAKYGIGQVDEMWDNILQYGTCDIDFLMQINKYDPLRYSRKGIYRYEDSLFPNTAYHYTFNLQGNFLGTATYIIPGETSGSQTATDNIPGKTSESEAVSQGRLDVFLLFCKYLERWFSLHIQEQDSIILDAQLRLAVSDPNADTSELNRRLLLRNWKTSDQLIFYKIDAPFQPYSINTHLMQNLNNAFEEHIAITTDLSICFLCNLTRQPREELEEKLTRWLLSSNYYATSGLTFSMEDSFYEQYQFVAMTSCHQDKTVGAIYRGNEYIMPYLFSQLQQTVVPDILHPAIHILRDYDQKHKTSFYQTFYTYLKCCRNIAQTAKELHLHRNTLLYRLERIQELISADLDDHLVRLHLMISFEIAKPQ